MFILVFVVFNDLLQHIDFITNQLLDFDIYYFLIVVLEATTFSIVRKGFLYALSTNRIAHTTAFDIQDMGHSLGQDKPNQMFLFRGQMYT